MRHALGESDGDASHTPADGAASALDQAAEGLGIDLDTLRKQRASQDAGAERADSVVEVWPELWAPLGLFQSLLPQFALHIGMGGAQVGAPRAVDVERHMEWLGIRGRRRQARVWSLYRLFERKAIDLMNKRAAKQAKSH